MGGRVYEFEQQLEKGEQGERLLDRYFSRTLGVDVKPVSMEMQLLGIDRLWERPNGKRLSVEYKTDSAAARTGNLFIEVLSNRERGKPGWALTSIAQAIIFYIPGKRKAYFTDTTALKRKLGSWENLISIRIRNPNYTSEGLLLPVRQFVRELGPRVYDLNL